jgi:beta-mannosidase
VHTDLIALGRIPDPFVGDNERRVQWVAEADWEYRYQFAVAPELLRQPHIWLVCDGLDTLATVSLNGRELGRAANMFRQYHWDVKPLLKAEGNELRIDLESVVRHVAQKQAIRSLPGVSQAIAGGPHVRKAPCQFGWDWGPQLPPVGIWKDIRLEAFDSARLSEVHLRQFHVNGVVRVEARLAVENWTSGLSALLQVTAPDGAAYTISAVLASASDNGLALEIENPQLWWPNGWGDQPLYHVEVQLNQSEATADNGHPADSQYPLDAKTYQLGLRTIELRQEPDEWGRSFTFVVNGRPLFAKGSNWIPADSFPTRLTEAALE